MGARSNFSRLVLGALSPLILLAPGPASAYPAAKVDALLTPHFGGLLDPPVRRPWGYERPWRWNDHQASEWRSEWRGGWAGRGGGEWGGEWRERWSHRRNRSFDEHFIPVTTISVDCGADRGDGHLLSDALALLADGGTLYIRQSAKACHETLQIDRPVTVVGESASAFDAPPGPGPAPRPVIVAPEGQPCVSIAPGVRGVELRNLSLVSDHAGRSACVEAGDADVALVGSSVSYAGQGPAVYSTGGRLILRGSTVEAAGAYAAVLADGSALQIQGGLIRSDSIGVDLTADPHGVSTLDGVHIVGPGPRDPRPVRTTGILLRSGGGAAGRVLMHGVEIVGWRTGLWVDQGATAEMTGGWIHQTRLGVLVDGGTLSLNGVMIKGWQGGVYVAGGRAHIDDGSRFASFDDFPVLADRGADLDGDGYAIYPREGCGPFKRMGRRCHGLGELEPEYRDADDGPFFGHGDGHGHDRHEDREEGRRPGDWDRR